MLQKLLNYHTTDEAEFTINSWDAWFTLPFLVRYNFRSTFRKFASIPDALNCALTTVFMTTGQAEQVQLLEEQSSDVSVCLSLLLLVYHYLFMNCFRLLTTFLPVK